MRVWQKYLPEIIALQLRAKQLQDTLDVEDILRGTPNQILNKLDVAHDAKHLYVRAHRLCLLIQGARDYNAPHKSINKLQATIESSMRYMDSMIRLLDNKMNQWGLREKTEQPELMLEDENAVVDGEDTDALKAELRHTLKALSDILEYMEKPTLLSVKKVINKLVHY